MKLLALALLSLFFVSCAGSNDPDAMSRPRKEYSRLSLEESKKLMTPTTYSISTFNLDTMSCQSTKKMKDVKGNTYFTVCSEVYYDCQMEGTCVIKKGGVKHMMHVDDVIEGERRFIEQNDTTCIYGRGARRDKVKGYKAMCLDPFYSVAADLTIYNLGDVIYVPAASGMILPDGSVHAGYFIVRDTGGAIKGYGRFDFFGGFKLAASLNPLKQVGFSDKGTNVPYYVMTGPEAANFLILRNFPLLPVRK